MNRNFVFRDVSEALPEMLHLLLKEGDDVPSRNGATKEFRHVGITLTEPLRRELLVPHRRPNLAAQIAETAWILAGRNDVTWLKNYLPRATDFSDDGLTWRAAYGPRLRKQLDYVVDILNRDPFTRQAVLTLWDPEVDRNPGKDIACNNWLHFLGRGEHLHLHVGIRSNDIIWGWSGINTFEWSVLLEIVAYMTGFHPGEIHYSVSSEHLYEHHWKRAQEIVEAPRIQEYCVPSPGFKRPGATLRDLDGLLADWFSIEGRLRQGDPCPEIETFPEPMLRSWLCVLKWWWTGDRAALNPINGTRLEEAIAYSIQPPPGSAFIRSVISLHNEKAAAYGDSWCRRGETLGILANIARKVDRISTGGETTDETSADTAIDLLVYLAKYRAWLEGDSSTEAGNQVLRGLDLIQPENIPSSLQEQFSDLEEMVRTNTPSSFKAAHVERMLRNAYVYARSLWK